MVWDSIRQFIGTLAGTVPDSREPVIVPAGMHPIKRACIDSDAVRISTALRKHGFKAFLVGGSVRDLLLGKKPKDYDIATNAHPNQIRRVFPNCRLIGRRFRLAHIYFRNNKIIETATFRNRSEIPAEDAADHHHDNSKFSAANNMYGTPETDALRRDITINGLFYNFEDGTIIDYVGGLLDLQSRLVRSISEPDFSFREDPVRMMRAVRHAARCDFNIESTTASSIRRNAGLLADCPKSRLLEEVNRDLLGNSCLKVFKLLHEYNLLSQIFPALEGVLVNAKYRTLLWNRMKEIEHSILRDGEIAYSIRWAVLLLACLEHDKRKQAGFKCDMKDYINTFGPAISMPRRHKERISQILCNRHKIFRWLKAENKGKSITTRNYFSDGKMLCQLLIRSDNTDSFFSEFDTEKIKRRKKRRRVRKSRPGYSGRTTSKPPAGKSGKIGIAK